MTNNNRPVPLAAPLVIASLTIGTPSTIMLDAIIETITLHGAQFTTDESNSIMTAAERLGVPAITTRIADALIAAQGNPITD